MSLSVAEYERRSEQVASSKSHVFSELIRLADLDPSVHLRFADWSGVDFSSDDLRDYDFTGANLRDCRFDGASIEGARFDLAEVDRSALLKSKDWLAHLRSWKPPSVAVTDFGPADLVTFSDAPFAPEMVVMPTGRFLMGSPDDEDGRDDDEGPQHEVTICRRFALGRYPVTEGEYRHVMEGRLGDAPEQGFSKDRLPKTDISWQEASAYCAALSERTGQHYRLPSEAEWEYACRAGSLTRFPWGDAISPKNANYSASDTKGPTEVDSYPSNDWGLHDVIGNVMEWCADEWHETYEDAPTDGSAWGDKEATGYRVMRGGSWFYDARYARAAARYRIDPELRGGNFGFRCARVQA